LKVLIAYYSETGNTEKVARAIFEVASKKHEAQLKKINDISVDALSNYDLVFLGSACHSSDLAASVKKVLDTVPNSPKFKLAGFFTHSTWTPRQTERARPLFDRWAGRCKASFEEVSKEKRIDFKGCYNCQGIPSPPIEEFIHKTIITSDKDWKEYIEEAKKHPSSEDLRKAKEFAQKVLSACNNVNEK
jgi:flavodoxin I